MDATGTQWLGESEGVCLCPQTDTQRQPRQRHISQQKDKVPTKHLDRTASCSILRHCQHREPTSDIGPGKELMHANMAQLSTKSQVLMTSIPQEKKTPGKTQNKHGDPFLFTGGPDSTVYLRARASTDTLTPFVPRTLPPSPKQKSKTHRLMLSWNTVRIIYCTIQGRR